MSLDLSADAFNALLTKAEGRDKVARFFQYTFRAFVGCSSLVSPVAGSRLNLLEGHARTAMTQLAGARRTHRWCKEIPVLQSIPQCFVIANPVDRTLELMQKVSLATFMIVDHIGHLKQWKILSGGKRAGSGTIQLGLKFFCYSNFIAVLMQLRKVLALGRCDDDEKKAAQRKQCSKLMLKHMLLVVQTAHLSLLYQSHDFVVGIAGAITSGMDVMAQWPAAKPKVAALKGQ